MFFKTYGELHCQKGFNLIIFSCKIMVDRQGQIEEVEEMLHRVIPEWQVAVLVAMKGV